MQDAMAGLFFPGIDYFYLGLYLPLSGLQESVASPRKKGNGKRGR